MNKKQDDFDNTFGVFVFTGLYFMLVLSMSRNLTNYSVPHEPDYPIHFTIKSNHKMKIIFDRSPKIHEVPKVITKNYFPKRQNMRIQQMPKVQKFQKFQ